MRRKVLRTIQALSKAYWLLISIIFVVGISQTLIGNYTFVAFQRLLDGFTSASQLEDLSPLLGMYIGANLCNHLLIYLEGIPGTVLDKAIVQWVKLRALEKIARIDYQAYQNLGTGNLVQTIENGAEAVRKILTVFFIGNLRSGLPQMIIGMYFIHYYDQTLFFLALGLYVLFLLVANRLMMILRRMVEKMMANQEDFSKFSVRAFMELVVFRVNGRFKAEIERLSGISDEIVRSRARVYLLQELAYTGFAFILFLVEAGVVIQQVGKILVGTSTVGTLVALVGFVRIVFWPIIQLGQSWMEYTLDLVPYARLDRILALPDDPGLERPVEFVMRQGQVSFEHVSFSYRNVQDGSSEASAPVEDNAREVLRDFSLTIEGGKTTALVGTSGSGKSTLARLLLHLLKPQQGSVVVDEQDLAHVNLPSYYRQVAYIPQEPPIFDGTLRENLTFDRPVDAAWLDAVVRQVGLDDLVRSLPRGLETLVGERGIKLSGGERQRLAFGRLLLQDPRIVILDEPTSALDSLTEDQVTRNLAAFLRGKTIVIVAHRLQTVQGADQIVVLEQGQVVQSGTFEELVAVEGQFRRLWEKQAREAVQEGAEAG